MGLRAAFVAVVVALSLFKPVSASEFVIIGAGATQSCGDWAHSRRAGAEEVDQWKALILASWIQGYSSGINAAYGALDKKLYLKLPNTPTMVAWFDNHCRANAWDDMHQAAEVLMKELRRRQ